MAKIRTWRLITSACSRISKPLRALLTADARRYPKKMKYLTEEQAIDKIKCNRSIEQWLDAYVEDDKKIIKFVNLYNDTRDGCLLWICEYENIGDEEYCDIYSFYSLDEGNPEGVELKFESVEEMLSYCYKNLNAYKDKFVGKGMLIDIYIDYLKNKNG